MPKLASAAAVNLVVPLKPLLLLASRLRFVLFSSTPRGLHWAEFAFAFFAAGVFGVPLVLGTTALVGWSSVAVSLGSSAAAAAGIGAYAVCRGDGDDGSLM